VLAVTVHLPPGFGACRLARQIVEGERFVDAASEHRVVRVFEPPLLWQLAVDVVDQFAQISALSSPVLR
jgi:hypothetical protein